MGCAIDFESISELISDETPRIELTRMQDLSTCDTTSFEDIVQGSVVNATATYDARMIPKNLLECDGNSCDFTGSVVLTRNAGLQATDPIGFTSVIDVNFVRYANGVVYAYIHAPRDTTATTVTFKASDMSDPAQPNADSFSITKDFKAGWNYVSYELADPSATVGTGWAKAAAGGLITVSIVDSAAQDEDQWVVSTFIPFEDVEDLEHAATLVLSCVTEASLELANTLTESDGCTPRTWDQTGQALTGNIVASNISGDRERFIPGSQRSKDDFTIVMKDIGGEDSTLVEAETINGKQVGTITLNKLSTEGDGCGRVIIRIQKGECQVDSFNYVVGTDLHTLNDEQYYIIGNKLILSADYVGLSYLVSYPTKRRAKVWDITRKGLKERTRTRFYMEIPGKDGTPTRTFYSDNVFLTSFPLGVTNGTKNITLPVEFGNYRGKLARIAVLQ